MSRTIYLGLAFAVSLLITSCAREIVPARLEEEEVVESCETDKGLIPGSVIVKFSSETADAIDSLLKGGVGTKSTLLALLPGTKASGLVPAVEALGIKTLQREIPDGGEFEARHRKYGLHQWYHVTYCDTIPQTKASMELGTVQGVDMVIESRKVESESVKLPFNDPLAMDTQWYLKNDGSLASGFLDGCDINVVPVWSNFTGGTSDVIVAVLDYGVQIAHPDMSGVVVPEGVNGSRNFIYNDSDPYKVYPENHGTHVATTIAAVNNNAIGICGIAGGKDGKGGVKILSCNFFKTNPDNTSSTLSGSSTAALVHAADCGAVIANNSWSYVYDSEDKVPDNSSSSFALIHTAIDYFVDNAGINSSGVQVGPMKGGVVFFSAGNKAWSKGQPAMYTNVLAVGACGPAFERASYSNYGDWVDICAPGGDYSRFGEPSEIYAGSVSPQYKYMQGTSMSCPVVSGVAALIVSYYGGQGFTAADLKKKLLDGARTSAKSYQDQPIGPLVDAFGAFSQSNDPIPQVKDLSGEGGETSMTLKWTVGEYAKGPVPQYTVAIYNNKAIIDFLKQTKIPSVVTTRTINTSSMMVGDTVTVQFDNLKTDTEYYCVAWGLDSRGTKYGTVSNTLAVKTISNNGPVLSIDNPGPFELKWNGTVSATVKVADDDNDTWTWETDEGSSAGSWTQTAADQWDFELKAAKAKAGDYIATISVTDHGGLKDILSINYSIAENNVPEVTRWIDDMIVPLSTSLEPYNLAEFFKDGDGDPMTFCATSDADFTSVTLIDSTMTIATGQKVGVSTISVSASDPSGMSNAFAFRVLTCDTSIAADIYPVPVQTKLYIRPRTSSKMSIKITSQQGNTVYKGYLAAEPFAPGSLNMASYAPGVYTITVSYDGQAITRKITKI